MTSVGTGRVKKSDFDGEDAGKELVHRAKKDADVEDPDFAMVFCSFSFDIEKMRKALSEELGDAPWIGATTNGEILNEGPGRKTAVMMVISSEKMDFDSGIEEGIFDDAEGAGKRLADELVDDEFIDSDRDKLFLMVNSYDSFYPGAETEILEGVREVIGSEAPIVGGAAGDDFSFKGSKVFNGEKVTSSGVAAATLETDYSIEMDQRNGVTSQIATGMVTDCGPGDARLNEIDGVPALEWYAEKIEVPKWKLKLPFSHGDWFRDLRTLLKLTPKIIRYILKEREMPRMPRRGVNYAMNYPFVDGLTPAENRVRVPHDIRGNSIIFLRPPIYENMEIGVGVSSTASCMECAKSLFDESTGETVFGFVSDCALRNFLLEKGDIGFEQSDQSGKEVENLNKAIGGPFIGFYTYGELGGKDKYNCNFKTYTLTSFVVKKDDE